MRTSPGWSAPSRPISSTDAPSLAANLVGAIVKDPVQDKVVLQEYLETVVRERKEWGDLYGAIREVM